MNCQRVLETLEHMKTICVDGDTENDIQFAIDAVKKQIEKPVRITTSTKRCGRCGRQLSGKGNMHPKRNYCTGCGQKIAWR